VETDATFREVKSELVDSRLLLETSQENFTEVGQKYEDAWVRIDQLNVSPISQSDRMIIFTLKSSRGTRRQVSSRHRWRKR
jgi:hypothetical protein